MFPNEINMQEKINKQQATITRLTADLEKLRGSEYITVERSAFIEMGDDCMLLDAALADVERLRDMVQDSFIAGFWRGVDHTEEDMSGPAAGDMVIDEWKESIQSKALDETKGDPDE